MLRVTVVTLCFFLMLCCVVALPHCERTEIPKRLVVSNVINVIYTMESSCQICVQQASKLPRLKRYLEKKGIKTHFIIGVSHKAERLSGLVPHIQVNSRHVWRSLGEQNNHFYIIDRCGRLVYEVINPWSNLNLAFVKAAVATTAHSHPCGLCPVDYTHVPKEEVVQEFPPLDSYSEALPKDTSPLKMNIRLRHKHKGDPNIYNYIVKVAGLPDFHGHLPNDQGVSSHHSPTPGISTIQEPEVTEKSSGFTMDYTTHDQNKLLTNTESPSHMKKSSTLKENINILSESTTSKDSTNKPTESSTLKYSINNPTESFTSKYSTNNVIKSSTSKNNINPTTESSTSKNKTPTEFSNGVSKSESTEPTASISSINNLRREEPYVGHGDKNLEVPIKLVLSETSHLETTTENIQTERIQNQGKTHHSESISSYDYDDDYEVSEEKDKELTLKEEAELKNLKTHYRRILDWMDFFSYENYD